MRTYAVTTTINNHTLTHIVVANSPQHVQAQLWDYLRKQLPNPDQRTESLRAAQIQELELDCEGVAFEMSTEQLIAAAIKPLIEKVNDLRGKVEAHTAGIPF